jgi:hypothetical protein
MDSRQEKIQLLSRINRGRAAAPSFLADLSEALGESVDASVLLPPSDTDTIMESLSAGYQSAIRPGAVSYRRFFLPDERSLVLRLADCLAERLSGERVFFVTKLSKDCGAVSLSISALLKHTASIIRLDGDSLSALSEDRKQGVLIDQNPDDPEQAYEVVVWGDHWPLLALACDPDGRR